MPRPGCVSPQGGISLVIVREVELAYELARAAIYAKKSFRMRFSDGHRRPKASCQSAYDYPLGQTGTPQRIHMTYSAGASSMKDDSVTNPLVGKAIA
jgi:hypothetical protein